MSSIRLAMGEGFLEAYAELPRKQQHKVTEFMKKFRNDPRSSGINFERINGTQDEHLRSVRIDQSYRGIVHKPESGNTYILLWVDNHDAAYDWARRRQLSVHPETGSLQVYEVQADTSSVIMEEPEESQFRLFRKLKERHLLQFGIPEKQFGLVKGIVSEKELDALAGRLPDEALECLQMFHEGIELNEILEDAACRTGEDIDTEDFDAALDRDGSKRSFHVVEDDEELAEMLAAPLEKWRVFLHPTQREVVERDWAGPVRILGGAGTGKTVVAIHRARWLARNRFTAAGDRILFTTYTKNLARDIRENLKSITSPEVMARIEVNNLDDWVWKFLRRKGYDLDIGFWKTTREMWNTALTLAPEGFDKQFFREEWDRIVQPQGIDSLSKYTTCSRIGRGTRLGRKQRGDVWQVFEEYRRLLDDRGLREPIDAMRDARHILEAEPGILPYRSVVVDEAQDMGPQEFQLIRQLVPPGKDETNSIFIVGDAHQRIYGRRVDLGQAGIDVCGRSRKLRINYRTTEENRAWAVDLLDGMTFDDLDGGTDDQKGYKSLAHGRVPEVHVFDSFEEEIDFIVTQLLPMLSTPGKVSSVCITARVNALLKQYEAELSTRGIATCFVSGNTEEDRTRPGVRLATMHRVKGLEFDTMIIAGVNRGMIPLPAAIDGSDNITRAEGEKSERALLYVAVTRARRRVLITAVKPVSGFLSSKQSQ